MAGIEASGSDAVLWTAMQGHDERAMVCQKDPGRAPYAPFRGRDRSAKAKSVKINNKSHHGLGQGG